MKRGLFVSLLGGILLSSSIAHAGEYRKLTLTDGRVLYVDVRQTVMSGLEIATPQGTSTIAFELLVNMEPIKPNEYIEQENWVVYLYGPEEKKLLVSQLYAAMPQVDVYGTDATQGFLTPDQEMAMEGCAGDMRCISKLASDLGTPWMWVVNVGQNDEMQWGLTSGLTGSSLAETVTLSEDSPEEWYRASYSALALNAPNKMPRTLELSIFGDASSKKATKPEKAPKVAKAPKAEKTPKPEKVARPDRAAKPEKPTVAANDKPAKSEKEPRAPRTYTEAELSRLTFVPLPGMPALAQGDVGKFGLAIGVAAPLTAAWAGAVGSNTQSSAEFATLTSLGFYALTVSINRALQKPRVHQKSLRAFRKGSSRKRYSIVYPAERGRLAYLSR